MKLYQKLSGIGFLQKSYTLKFLFIAFIGIHIPLIGILFFVLYADRSASPNAILIFALLMTLIATAATLLVLRNLILPIEIASRALQDYRSSRVVAQLPSHYHDEAGQLMRNIQESIARHENFIIEKQDLLYLLSHDLKTFSGNTQSLSKLLMDEDIAGPVQEYAELIYQSSSQQIHFIENFIRLLKEQDELSKYGSDVLHSVNLMEVMNDLEQNIAQQLHIKNIGFVTNLKIQHARLPIEENLLLRVLVNLADNAIKFSHPADEIQIDAFEEANQLHIVVTDHGMGFDARDKEEMFKKFTKGKTGTANESSTGIGLYLSRKIIEKHGGQLLADSKGAGQGAVFSIVLNLSEKRL